MEGGGEQAAERPIVYCLVPRSLAAKLHEPLRRHFREDPAVEVVVERRGPERRDRERRGEVSAQTPERRLIRNAGGRRIGERRATAVAFPAPELPRRARRYADQIAFVELLVPSAQQLEDLVAGRLVTRFQAGDRDSFADLYTLHFDRVYSYLRVALNDPHAAEDATQQVFTKVLQALPRYERRPGTVFRAWLFAIARNEARAVLGKRGRVEPTDPVALAGLGQIAASGDDELPALGWISDRELLMLIERLPLAQRQVLVLRYMLDLSYTEIGEILERTAVDVRSLHSRGIRFLRSRLEGLGRAPTHGRRTRMRSCLRRAPVIGARRWALER